MAEWVLKWESRGRKGRLWVADGEKGSYEAAEIGRSWISDIIDPQNLRLVLVEKVGDRESELQTLSLSIRVSS